MNNYSFYLAPLQGLTNYIFRKVYREHFNAIDKFFAPYITGNLGKAITASRLKEILPENNEDNNLIPQILIRSDSEFEYIIGPICELGYKQININMGCPFPMAVKKGRGAGLLPNYRDVSAILDKADLLDGIEISVKVRLGLDDKNELSALVPVFNDHKVKEVIIHPRIAAQLYDGSIDLDMYKSAFDALNTKVVYNGDIYSKEIFTAVTGRIPGTESFMFGRGLLMNPCLTEEIRQGAAFPGEIRKKRIKAFIYDLFSLYRTVMSGERHTLDKMKGYWAYLSLLFDNPPAVFKKISKARNTGAFNLAVEEIFSQVDLLDEPEASFSRNPL